MVRILGLGSMTALLAMTFGVGCGSVDNQPGPQGEAQSRFTLSAGLVGFSEGLVLATGEKVVAGEGEVVGDIHASLGKVLALSGTPDDQTPFCEQGQGFADVTEVPVDTAACGWNVLYITGNAAGLERGAVNDGYLVRDRSGAMYRMLVVGHEIQDGPENIGSVTFDLLPLE